MSKTIDTRVLVVGGGPGGYVAAIRAGQLGLDTTLVEADRVGGTCLIRGCIPSKALIEVASEFETLKLAAHGDGQRGIRVSATPQLNFGETIAWKNGVVDKLNNGVGALLKRAGVKVVRDHAVFSDAKTCTVKSEQETLTIRAQDVILATGSVPAALPFLPFGGKVISSTEALSLPTLPQRLVVVGAGYIGLELGIAFRKLGVDVSIVESQAQILPLYDEALVAPVRRWLQRAGVNLHLSAKALGAGEHGLRIETADGVRSELPAEAILVTVGRRPCTDGWGLETMGVDLDGRFVKIDEQCRTSMRGVWAIGDLVGEPMLAHKASAQGEMVAEIIAGQRRRFDPATIAAVCFTEPEIVTAGLLPDAARQQYDDVIVGQFPLQANGRAMSMAADGDGGFVRVVSRASDHRVLGVQAVGRHLSEMAGEFALAIEMGAQLEDIAGTIHVHPTLSEAFHEAALKALGHALHI